MRLALGERHGDEARLTAALHTHQHDVLVVVLCGVDGIAHVTGTRDYLAGNFENDVAFLEAALGGRALGIDLGHDDAFLAGAGDAIGGSHRQPKPGHIGAARLLALVVVVVIGLGLDRVRQRAQRQVDDLVRALVEDVELDRAAGRNAADGAGELARVLHRLAVDRGDDVAGFDAGLGRGAVGLRFGNQRAFRLLQAEAVGDLGSDGLNLYADPAAAHRALVLELVDDGLHRRRRNREGDADAAAGRRIDRSIDADDFAGGVEGRATR